MGLNQKSFFEMYGYFLEQHILTVKPHHPQLVFWNYFSYVLAISTVEMANTYTVLTILAMQQL